MLNTRAHGFTEGGVTLVQFAPPSVVTWMTPSSLPVQMILMSRGLALSAVMLPAGAGVTVLAYFPAFVGTAHVWRVRSGLMRVQLFARSVDFHTTFDV